MAPSYISAVVLILSQVLPWAGIRVDSEALMTTVQTLIAIGVGLIVVYRQLANGRSTLVGTRPQ